MGNCLSCILGDSEEASSPNAFTAPSALHKNNNNGSSHSSSSSNNNKNKITGNKFLNSSPGTVSGSQYNPKAKLKSDRIDALIEKQASEQNNIVKILLLGKRKGALNANIYSFNCLICITTTNTTNFDCPCRHR